MRENGGNFDFSFVSLPNPVVDENCLNVYLLDVSTFLCTDRLSFYYFRLLTLEISFALCTNYKVYAVLYTFFISLTQST